MDSKSQRPTASGFAELHGRFSGSRRRHVLQITNHGIHQWDIIPGLPDTGGQNVFVNHLTTALARLGLRITVANRGGYPHPVTGEPRQGLHYRDDRRRIIYLRDSRPEFVAKEEMASLVDELGLDLWAVIGEQQVDLLVSHYWDGAAVAARFNARRERPVPHVWVPHSLGTIKKRNVDPARWAELRVDERIELERQLAAQVDRIAATSRAIQAALEDDYGLETSLYLPPCVDAERYRPRTVADDDPLWAALGEQTGLGPQESRHKRLITEVSRTDRTKRKDVLIRAFARIAGQHPDTLLVVTVDDRQQPLAGELRRLIEARGLASRTAVLGSIWDLLPSLYAASHVYCTPSVMEGFGMSAQEAAACGVPVVASDLVPYALEHLLGNEPSGQQVRRGEAAVVVAADDVEGFAGALDLLLGDEELRQQMSRRALEITVPAFTWERRTAEFLEQCGVTEEQNGPA
jgi:glycosyltransferase involved in cell wall biosynthesis